MDRAVSPRLTVYQTNFGAGALAVVVWVVGCDSVGLVVGEGGLMARQLTIATPARESVTVTHSSTCEAFMIGIVEFGGGNHKGLRFSVARR